MWCGMAWPDFLEGQTGLLRESGPHAFFEYFELGDTAALQPLCDALA